MKILDIFKLNAWEDVGKRRRKAKGKPQDKWGTKMHLVTIIQGLTLELIWGLWDDALMKYEEMTYEDARRP